MRTSRPAFKESGAGGRSYSQGAAPPPECLPSQDTSFEDQSIGWPEACLVVSKLGIERCGVRSSEGETHWERPLIATASHHPTPLRKGDTTHKDLIKPTAR